MYALCMIRKNQFFLHLIWNICHEDIVRSDAATNCEVFNYMCEFPIAIIFLSYIYSISYELKEHIIWTCFKYEYFFTR